MGSLALCIGVVMGKRRFWGSPGWFGLTQAGSRPYAEPHLSLANAAGLLLLYLKQIREKSGLWYAKQNAKPQNLPGLLKMSSICWLLKNFLAVRECRGYWNGMLDPVGRNPTARADVTSPLCKGSVAGALSPSALCCAPCELRHQPQHTSKGRCFGIVPVSASQEAPAWAANRE